MNKRHHFPVDHELKNWVEIYLVLFETTIWLLVTVGLAFETMRKDILDFLNPNWLLPTEAFNF